MADITDILNSISRVPAVPVPMVDTPPALPPSGFPPFPNVRHSKENPDWQTPLEDIECARVALGGRIGLDPFSCVSGNTRVGAEQWFGPDHPDPERRDGFAAPWIADTLYENHPGGTTARAWQKTCVEFAAGHFRAGIWMGFTVEQVCILSDPSPPDEPIELRWARSGFVPTDFSLCFLRKRVGFIDARNPDRRSAPAHANFIIGIGTEPRQFELAYASRGQCIHGALTMALQKTG